jgi:uncharacterized protein (DUF3084 family)
MKCIENINIDEVDDIKTIKNIIKKKDEEIKKRDEEIKKKDEEIKIMEKELNTVKYMILKRKTFYRIIRKLIDHNKKYGLTNL